MTPTESNFAGVVTVAIVLQAEAKDRRPDEVVSVGMSAMINFNVELFSRWNKFSGRVCGREAVS